jgi:putative FmdB family regulatory protein
MPIREFECTSCGSRFERLQKLSDSDPTQCPQCGETSLARRLSAPAFRLAGKGWYETDFKKEGDKKHNLANADAPAPQAEAKVESVPEKKAEAKPAPAKPAATE